MVHRWARELLEPERVESDLPPTEQPYLDDALVRVREVCVPRYAPRTESVDHVVLDKAITRPKRRLQSSDVGAMVAERAESSVKKVIDLNNVLMHCSKLASGTGRHGEVKATTGWESRYTAIRHRTTSRIDDEGLTSASEFHGQPESCRRSRVL
ncbi:MAG: hypothetical protein NZ988_00710 [Thaumarchaeota archaeon]|nr:hypothetical protein [Candidatus Calditenuaceae archaeon]MDW8186555.1 hypothetical protein [Nitrososphaerota archaeon]